MIEETTKLENFQKSLNGDGDNDDGDDDDDEDGHDFTVIDTSKLNENEIVLNNSVLITNGYYHDDRKRAKRDVKQNKNKLVYNNNYHETKIITESEESIQGLKIQIQKEFIHFEGFVFHKFSVDDFLIVFECLSFVLKILIFERKKCCRELH